MTQPFDPAADPRAWWRNQVELHPPQSPEVGRAMDSVRGWFRSLGDMLIEELPPGPDLTVALRELKAASALAIGAIAVNQWYYREQSGVRPSGPMRDVRVTPLDEKGDPAGPTVRLDDDARGFVPTAAGHPCWPDGAPIEVGQAVEVVGGDGWSGAVVAVRWRPGGGSRDTLVLVERTGGEFDQYWCTPGALIRRGTGKASASDG